MKNFDISRRETPKKLMILGSKTHENLMILGNKTPENYKIY